MSEYTYKGWTVTPKYKQQDDEHRECVGFTATKAGKKTLKETKGNTANLHTMIDLAENE